jgi:DNA-binding PadR family transcriptional regulator
MTRLNERQLRILRTIAHSPRSAQHFTHGEALVASPPVIAAYLEHMVEAGLIQPGRDTYAITEAGTAYLASEPEIVRPRYYGNASMSSADPYRTAWKPVREGADEHLEYRSRGV